MPELPEVEAHRQWLENWTGGSSLRDLRLTAHYPLPLTWVGKISCEVRRHGKRLAWFFSGEEGLLCHLGMTGSWQCGDATPPRWAHLGLHFSSIWVWYCDPRRFGKITIYPNDHLWEACEAGHGPDAYTIPHAAALKSMLHPNQTLKTALMDQSQIAGLGNIHASEVLWRARCSPFRKTSSLSKSQWSSLHDAIQTQLRETCDQLLTHGVQYVNLGGSNTFSVYKQSICPRCSTTIAVEKISGRSTYWCPKCQD